MSRRPVRVVAVTWVRLPRWVTGVVRCSTCRRSGCGWSSIALSVAAVAAGGSPAHRSRSRRPHRPVTDSGSLPWAAHSYLLARQHLPVARAAELMADCLDAPVSAGWLAGLLPAAADRLDGFTEAMRDQLQAAPVAHFDETGGRVAARCGGSMWPAPTP
jgi:hypothetical protein